MTEALVNAKRIVVAEYPKSGGSWLVSMLGAALNLPRRDIYHDDGFNLFDLTKHPWYEDAQSFGLTEACVIKSHELPDSHLHNFPARFIHLIRDGRDVVVSKYFFEKEFCLKNGIMREFKMTFGDHNEKTATEWCAFVNAWLDRDVITCRYEDLLRDTRSTLQKVISSLGEEVEVERIDESIKGHTKEKMKKSLDKAFKHNTFVRKGISGDWKNHFSEAHKEIFKKYAGEALIRCGYEDDTRW